MAQQAETGRKQRPKGRKRRWLRKAFSLTVLLMIGAGLLAWAERERLADDLIADTFRDQGVRASYEIESIAPRRQVLSNIVIGDPARPDLTVARIEISLTPRLGLPDVTHLTLTRPRLYGSLRNGQLSFGALDPFIFTGSGEPFEFPRLELAIRDGGGVIESDYGRIGVAISGAGHLRGGFSGKVAAIAPRLAVGGCVAQHASLYGTIGIDAERPVFSGPVRFDALACEEAGVAIAKGAAGLKLRGDRNMADFEGAGVIKLDAVEAGLARIAGFEGETAFTWRDGDLTGRYDLAARQFEAGYARIASLALEGRIRTANDFGRADMEGELRGTAAALGPEAIAGLRAAESATGDTLLAPLLARLRRNLVEEAAESQIFASYTARQIGDRQVLVIPEARWRGEGGATLLSLSRARLTSGGGGLPRVEGNFATGGAGLPRIAGRMEQSAAGALVLRMRMPEFAAGSARMAVPRLQIVQREDGGITFRGRAIASGPLPGGIVRELHVPLEGTIAQDGSLALWDECQTLRFDRLAFADVALARQSLVLCPPPGQPMLQYGDAGLRLAAGAASLDLRGTLAGTPVLLRGGPVGIAYPGALSARNLAISLGPAAAGVNFVIADLQADFSAAGIGGNFAGADVRIAAVPLDVLRAAGDWRYVNGALLLQNGRFTLKDRQPAARFEPLAARNARLRLVDNRITAQALLREPDTDTAVTRADIVHNLASGRGHAALAVDGIRFNEGLQPLDLSRLALGVVANVEGTVTGSGRIDWNAAGITSSGRFSSESLDFAAAFGPVKGASGTVEFADLLGLTTAPDQRIAVAAINPGIEVYDGDIGFTLRNGEVIAVTGGVWPFMGGRLELRPLDITIGARETRTYLIVVEGLEAAQFVERMELNNLAASGTFDGRIPIVFDADGNGTLEGGTLRSRAPGGHVSYVGQLTYEDMSFFAEYAFQALRDLRYEQAEITLNGPLTGELVTQVRFEEIAQGETAQQDFITRRIGRLPIELRLNIHAPFYKLISSVRSLYDPSAVRDPRSLGLLTDEGTRLRATVSGEEALAREEDGDPPEQSSPVSGPRRNEPDIQPAESEAVP